MATAAVELVLPEYIKSAEGCFLRYKTTQFNGRPIYLFYQIDSSGNKVIFSTTESCYIEIPQGHNPINDPRYVKNFGELCRGGFM